MLLVTRVDKISVLEKAATGAPFCAEARLTGKSGVHLIKRHDSATELRDDPAGAGHRHFDRWKSDFAFP
jgi:hypothetical protein